LCTYTLKHTVDYYTSRGSHVFACFIDYSKAFDTVLFLFTYYGPCLPEINTMMMMIRQHY